MRRWQSWRVRKEEPYKAVPYLDLLGRNEGARRTRLIVRGVLALLLVGGALLLQDLYRSETALQEEVGRVEGQLEKTHEELGAAQREVEGLNNQIQQLQKREASLQEMQVRWEPTLTALGHLQGDSIAFWSLEGDAGGTLTLVAVSTEGTPLARLQVSLQGAGLPFTLRTVRWKRQEGETVMTATLLLRREP